MNTIDNKFAKANKQEIIRDVTGLAVGTMALSVGLGCTYVGSLWVANKILSSTGSPALAISAYYFCALTGSMVSLGGGFVAAGATTAGIQTFQERRNASKK